MPASTTSPPAGAQSTATQPGAIPQGVNPFPRAAIKHSEQFFDSGVVALTGSTQQSAPIDVVAYGFARAVVIQVTITSVSGGTTGAFGSDGAFPALTDIQLLDVNQSPIDGPIGGYALNVWNKHVGVAGHPIDPKLLPDYTTGGTPLGATFSLRLPVEINHRTALGSLANGSASVTFKVRYTLASTAVGANNFLATAPAGSISVQVKMFLEAWSHPNDTDPFTGVPNLTMPPAHTTTQFVSRTLSPTINTGSFTYRLSRVGGYIRHLMLICRDTNGARTTNANLPDPITLSYDTHTLLGPVNYRYLRQLEAEAYGGYATTTLDAAGGPDTGVLIYDWAHDLDGTTGSELNDQWLPTTAGTRLDLTGTMAAATTLEVVTTDVTMGTRLDQNGRPVGQFSPYGMG